MFDDRKDNYVISCFLGVERAPRTRLALLDAGFRSVDVYPGGMNAMAETPLDVLAERIKQNANVVLIYEQGEWLQRDALETSIYKLQQLNRVYQVSGLVDIMCELTRLGINPRDYFGYS